MVSLELRWVRLRGARSARNSGLKPTLALRVVHLELVSVLVSAQALRVERRALVPELARVPKRKLGPVPAWVLWVERLARRPMPKQLLVQGWAS